MCLSSSLVSRNSLFGRREKMETWLDVWVFKFNLRKSYSILLKKLLKSINIL